jgi:hypothetical protein
MILLGGGLVAAVLVGALLFQFRVRVAGLKYLILILGVLALAWWLGRRRR